MNLPYKTAPSAHVDPLDQWLSEQPTDPREIQKWAARMPMQAPVMPPPPKPAPPADPHKQMREEIETLRAEVTALRAELEQQRAEDAGWTRQAFEIIAAEAGEITGGLGREIDELRKRLTPSANRKPSHDARSFRASRCCD